jgi:two-component system, chemotaxis family, chemotaxis protein CheY
MKKRSPLPSVLIIDPDPVACARTLGAVVEHATVLVAHTIAEAMQQLTMQPPTFILLEWQLPDADGLAFVQQCKGEPRFSATQIACVSRANGARERARAYQAGADAYFVQPVDGETFWWRLVLLGKLRTGFLG